MFARLLAEYFRDDERTFAAFDVNPDDFALAQQLPDYTTIAHIGDTKGQMALFDQLIIADEVAKVVDLGYACFERFFTVMEEIGFEAEAFRQSITPAALFLSDTGARLLTPIASLGLAVLMLGAVQTHRRLHESFVPAGLLVAVCVAIAAARFRLGA